MPFVFEFASVPLDQNTELAVSGLAADGATWLMELIGGAIHVLTRTPKPFKVDTPYMNASVEGTEFYVALQDTSARVGVFEGKVNVSNGQGNLVLAGNETAFVAKGAAPKQDITIKPRDAVQWALYYPPIIDARFGSVVAGGESEGVLKESIDL